MVSEGTHICGKALWQVGDSNSGLLVPGQCLFHYTTAAVYIN